MLFLSEQRTAHMLSRIAKYGELTTKSQFGGFSMMVDEIMLAINSDGEFYLKGSGFLETLYKATKMNAYVYLKKGSPITLRYYRVTDLIWEDQRKLEQYIDLSYHYSVQEYLRRRKQPSRIKDLPNLGVMLERKLNQIGINKVEELRLVGAKASYLKLMQLYNRKNSELLLALAGAIVGCHRSVLPDQLKMELLDWHNEL
ncbi:TfoX/Sxy family DNA transformation protein [Proteus hauseri]|uniref:TfoX/Sxy family DNA transformation protein n=1 Tax=Proteus hauseri TaxID=183417 RepID=UPI0032DBE443